MTTQRRDFFRSRAALAHVEGSPVVGDQSRLALATQELGLHFEIAGLDVVIDENFDLDGTTKLKPSLTACCRTVSSSSLTRAFLEAVESRSVDWSSHTRI